MAHCFYIFDGIKSNLIWLTKTKYILLTEVARLKCLNGNRNPKQNSSHDSAHSYVKK